MTLPAEGRQLTQLELEVAKERATIKTDQVSMSIGELATLYRDGELHINPEFQRAYRWDEDQKAKLIESILLGIPLPSIFVAQRDDGVWDVVDGLQRLATIFEFMGVLRGATGSDGQPTTMPPLILHKTHYLPSMEGAVWDKSGQSPPELAQALKLDFKRQRLEVKVLKRESSDHAKFELFQRLNTGGTKLSEQEIRNAILIAANRDFYVWLKEMAESEDFANTVALTDRLEEERFNYELALRFLILRRTPTDDLSKIGDIGDFLTNKMREIVPIFASIRDEETKVFKETFSTIHNLLGPQAFRKYIPKDKRFTGGFSISAFEVLAIGLGSTPRAKPLAQNELLDALGRIWGDHRFRLNTGSGVRASTRIAATLPLARAELAK